MRRIQRSRKLTARSALWLAALCTTAATPSLGQLSNPSGTDRNERPVLPKAAKTTIDPNASRTDVIVVKFREGTGLRLRGSQWAIPLGARSPDQQRLLQRANLDEAQLVRDLEVSNSLLQDNVNVAAARLFTRPEEELDFEKQLGEQNSNEELADLNLYYHLFVDDARVEDTEALIDQLNALSIVEVAYPQPIYQQAQAPGTPDFTGQQGHLNAASVTTPGSNGLDSRYAWTLAGGKGQNVRMIDIEYDWRDGHEDLPGIFYESGVRDGANRNHGSAVLGVVAGVENSFGITGMAPRLPVGFAHPLRQVCTPPPCHNVYDVADAVNRAAGALNPGEIILIEQQVLGPVGTLTCSTSCGNCGQFGDVAVEYNQAEYDAIRSAALSNSVIVVEAGGNGQMNLDDSRYNRVFDRTFRDSYAIMVGAGSSTSRSPWCWSSAGTRLDVQGWGDGVVTAGYGDLQGSGLPETRWYTSGFGGTSSGSAIISAAVANVQGVRRTRGLTYLSGYQMRLLLKQTGVAQASGRQIGPLPNLKDAIAIYVEGSTAVFFRYGIPDQPFKTIAEALGAAWDRAQIKISAGNYPEHPTITQPMFLMTRGGTVTIGQ